MDRSAIILNNSDTTNLEQDKALIELNGKPLIKHIVGSIEPIVDEIIVVANSQESLEKYLEVLGPHVQIIVNDESSGLLSDALKGFEAAKNKFTLLLPSNTPFVSLDIVDLLFELCHSRSAAIPRSPDQEVELLHAVYNTKIAIEAARIALNERGKTDLLDMVENMGGVRYVSTLVIQELDPELKMFRKVNRSVDLRTKQATINKRLKLNKKR
jgi:molybdopterin-guanine dinucleotide biosynthesis protein A